MTEPEPAYAELHCHSTFSLLDGASSPEALVAQAQVLGLRALALTDHDSLAGAVRFYTAAQAAGLHAVIGTELTLDHDGEETHLTLLAETQQGYANLCRLITQAHLGAAHHTSLNPPLSTGEAADTALGSPLASREAADTPLDPPLIRGEGADPPLSPSLPGDEAAARPGKTSPRATWEALAAHRAGLIALSGCRRGPLTSALLRHKPEQATAAAQRLRDLFGPAHLFVELQQHYLPDDDHLLRQLLALSRALDLPTVATNNVHYATRAGSRLRDALIAIRHRQSLRESHRLGRLPLNSHAALAAAAEMARRFADAPGAVRATMAIAERCQAAPDFGAHRLPAFEVPEGLSEFAYLYQLCHDNLARCYPRLTPAVLTQLAHELQVIEDAHLAGYFLIVWDIVRFARARGIRCQGRGSAANSLVTYLLGITSIDPLQHHLLFERFLSADRHSMPDIDIDFAADRREEVIQYVYGRYGRAHVAMVCNVVTYHARSAVRDLGKALDFPTPVIDRLAQSLETNAPRQAAEQLLAQAGPEPPANHPLRRLAELMREIDGCPRHLSIHSGGMLITGPRLDEVVPLEPATMPGRVVCQWDKHSVEDAGLIKIDLLGLRALGMLTEALEYIDDPPDLEQLPLDDPAVYELMRKADAIGAFQVESRAQQQMLPRLAPQCFEDIVVEVAIIRPGPIQGGAVHPYLRRRAGLEPVTYAHPCLEPVLGETLGVLLFQEQAIRMAVVAASFSPGEADALRRALARYGGGELTPALRVLGERFLAGAVRNGLDTAAAEAAFKQLASFAGYGLCKSHAASFARLAYQTLWLKHYHPAAFYCALLNQQPMGFYSPEVIVGDMKRHGISLLPPDINRSGWGYTVEDARALRMGLQAVSGLGAMAWQCIQHAREAGLFMDLRDFCLRTRLPRDTVADLIRAGALDRMGERRNLLWALGEIDDTPDELSLDLPVSRVELPELEPEEQTVWEYELLGLSPVGQRMQHYRPALQRAGVLSVAETKRQRAGRRVRVAGMPAVRQRPPTAKGILFLSLEDETGLIDVVVRPDVYERQRHGLRNAAMLLIDGVIQSVSGAVSVLATTVISL